VIRNKINTSWKLVRLLTMVSSLEVLLDQKIYTYNLAMNGKSSGDFLLKKK
jgi:hypothetical protein